MIKLTWASQWLQNDALKAWNLRAMNSLHVRRGIHGTLPVWSRPLLTSKCSVQCAFPPLNPYSFLWIQQGLWESTIFWNKNQLQKYRRWNTALNDSHTHKKENLMFLACICVLNFSVVSDSLWPRGLYVLLLAPLSMEVFQAWSGLPCSPPEDLPEPDIEPTSIESPALAPDSLPLSPGSLYYWH